MADGGGLPMATKGEGTGEGEQNDSSSKALESQFLRHLDECRGRYYGPAPVPDDDGQEHVLVHIIGINGEWLWSSIEPEYVGMCDLQARFHLENRHLLQPNTFWLLMWDLGEVGPYPQEGHAGVGALPESYPLYTTHETLRYVTGVHRSEETQEVFVTAVQSSLLFLQAHHMFAWWMCMHGLYMSIPSCEARPSLSLKGVSLQGELPCPGATPLRGHGRLQVHSVITGCTLPRMDKHHLGLLEWIFPRVLVFQISLQCDVGWDGRMETVRDLMLSSVCLGCLAGVSGGILLVVFV